MVRPIGFSWDGVNTVFGALTLLVGRQEGHPACKNMEDGGGELWLLVRMEWRPSGWSVCLPLSIFPCTTKSRSSLLAPAHPGGPGKGAVKQLWCGGGGVNIFSSRRCSDTVCLASGLKKLDQLSLNDLFQNNVQVKEQHQGGNQLTDVHLTDCH